MKTQEAPVCQALLRDEKFYQQLFRMDQDLAQRARAGGCPLCGSRLHSARYPRKPRGVPWELSPDDEKRFSFCCSRCFKRHTPASVRFLGRRVYVAAVVVLATAMSSGITQRRAAKLKELFGVDRRTLDRWRQWWQEAFVQSALWIAERGRFSPAVNELDLPGSLLERFVGTKREKLLATLLFLSPLSTAK